MKRHYELDRNLFPLPAFALLGNWYFRQHFKQTAHAKNSTFVSSIAPPDASLTKELFFCSRTTTNLKQQML